MLHTWKKVSRRRRVIIFHLIHGVMLNNTVIRHYNNNTWLAQYMVVFRVDEKLIRIISGQLRKCVNKPTSSNTSHGFPRIPSDRWFSTLPGCYWQSPLDMTYPQNILISTTFVLTFHNKRPSTHMYSTRFWLGFYFENWL